MPTPRKPFWHCLHDYFLPHSRNVNIPHLFGVKSIALVVLAVLLLEGAYLMQTKVVFLKTDFLAAVLPGALMALTNQDRALYGLASLTEDPLLSKAAQAVATDMATKGYFAHVSPDGKDPWYWLKQVGYSYRYAGENLAVNFTDSKSVEAAWMESSTHRANIIKKEYTHIGFGVANGMYEGRETTFVVQFFATPAKATTSTSAARTRSGSDLGEVSATGRVLGSQSLDAPRSGWIERIITSPLTTLTAILTVLFAIIAIALSLTAFIRVRNQHPRVLLGGALMLALIGGSLAASSSLAGEVKLVSGTQIAAVAASVPQ